MASFNFPRKNAILGIGALLAALTLGFLLFSSPAPSLDERPMSWQGTIRVRTWAEGAPCLTGVFDTSWTVSVKWEESGRIDVRDRKGNLVGQFVRFKDAGTTWSGKESGTFINNAAGSVREEIYSGSGSGTGNAFYDAVVYFRLSENDPLKDVLPHGAYAVNTALPAIAAFDTSVRNIQTYRDGRVSEWTSNFNKIAMLRYSIGELALGLNSRRWTGSIVAEDIKPFVQGVDMDGHDNVMRSLSDGRMKGSYDNKAPHGISLGKNRFLHNTVSWEIGRRMNVQAALEKAPGKWRPKGGPQKNSVQVTARIEAGRNYKGKFRFTLFEVSREKGWAMNAGDETTFDLRFAPGQAGFAEPVAPDSLVIEGTETVEEAKVTVEALDYGAWGKLKAEVNVDGEWYEAKTPDGKSAITIPLDEDENHIADDWEREWSVSGEPGDADNDLYPLGVGWGVGDGFPNYEEYRGFLIKDKWTDTSPALKDLFILDEAYYGIGYFDKLQIQVHLIKRGEFDMTSHVVDFNRGWAQLTSQNGQKGILLKDGDLADKDGWVTLGEAKGGPGTPNKIKEVIIDVAAVYLCKEDLDSIIAHELGHAVNIWHHGETDYDGLARRGGLWSGDISCVMRYARPKKYLGSDGQKYAYPKDEGAPVRLDFCTSKTGTGINTPGERTGPDGQPYPAAGDATRGECKDKVRLKG